MNLNWLAVVIPGLLGALVARYMYVASKSPASTFDESNSSVTCRQQRQSAVVGVVIIAAPWAMIGRALGEPEQDTAVGWFGLMTVLSCGGLLVLILALRKIIISRDGIQVKSTFSLRYTWDELRDIETTDTGSVAVAKFFFGKRKVVVDSNMDGFRQLVRALEVWPTGNAKPIAERAAKALANWRNDPEPKK
jgi:hypothetical protein